MKNNFTTLYLLSFISMTIAINPQSFFRSVADVDSFAYVTKDDKILVLKRDQANDLRLVNFLPFLTNYKDNMFNSAIIINDYLLVSSKDSLVLFSISDRINPVELNRIYIGNIFYINKFGNYCLAYLNGSPPSPLIKIENDNLQIINNFPLLFYTSNPVVYYIHSVALSYPYIYQVLGDSILIYRYNENSNELLTIAYTSNNDEIHGLVANSLYLFTLGWHDGFPYGERFFKRYQILIDSLKYIDTPWYSGGNTAIPWGWSITNTFGKYSYLYIANSGQPSKYNWTPGPNTYISNIEENLPANSFSINNSVYRIGEDNLWYLHQINGMDLTFKQFIMPTLPSKPILVSPLNNQLIHSDTVNFIWRSSAPEIIDYSLDISSDSLFTTFSDTLIADTFYTKTGLNQNQKYFWRVRAQNLIGWSSYSNTGSFTVLVTSVENVAENDLQFNLEQNYPNPFNPSTKISWQSPVGCWQTLKVFDVLGREVAKLVNEEKPAGKYEIEFNAENLSSGVYIYVLKTAGNQVSHKMVYQK